MRLVIVVTCFLAGCLAQRHQPCTSPARMSGAFSLATQKEKQLLIVHYLYDAVSQRMRLLQQASPENTTFIADYLLQYKENTLYKIIDYDRTCEKLPLKADFQPLGIPQGASLMGKIVLGSSSGPEEGVLVNTWAGNLPEKAGKYLSTVTETGCFPIGTVFITEQRGWVAINFFNNVVGITDPRMLDPLNFCAREVTNSKGQQEDFISLFLKTK